MRLIYVVLILSILLLSVYSVVAFTGLSIDAFDINMTGNVSMDIDAFDIIMGPVAVGPPSVNDSCTYSGSGNHVYQCADACNITSQVDHQGNDIIFNGTGTIRLTADIINYGKVTIQGTDSTNICTVRCEGGCLIG